MKIFAACLFAFLASVALAADEIPVGLYHMPAEPGHGLAVYDAPEGYYVATWYTYQPTEDSAGSPIEPGQAWLITDNFRPGQSVDLYRPTGVFPALSFELGEPVGEATIDAAGELLAVDFVVFDWSEGCLGGSPVGFPVCRGFLLFERLTP